MAEEHRRIVAATEGHARALAENLLNDGFVVTMATDATWALRKRRRRGDIVATIAIQRPRSRASSPPPTAPWGPPSSHHRHELG